MGEVYTIEVKVRSAEVPRRVTLAYSDYSGLSLVNNLNLIVTPADGKK
jgi:hypothetical protein